MCIVFIARQLSPDYPLVLLANRDEYFKRPTESAHWWPDQPSLYAGRDLQAGGSWFGINRAGDFCAVTNVRQAHDDSNSDNSLSRGQLVVNSLMEKNRRAVVNNSTRYRPFNLIFGNSRKIQVFHSPEQSLATLESGVHAISNGNPKDYWVKMTRGCKRLQACFASGESPSVEALHQVLLDTQTADASSLARTGLPATIEQSLSSIFIPAIDFRDGLYGTRSSGLLLMKEQQWEYHEWVYDSEGAVERYSWEQYPENSIA